MNNKVSEAIYVYVLDEMRTWHQQVTAQSARHVLSYLPIKFKLKDEIAGEYHEKDDDDFLRACFAVEGSSSEEPFFDPFAQQWLKSGYAHSNVATTRKRTFFGSWRAGDWDGKRVELQGDADAILAERGLTKSGTFYGLPLLATSLWFWLRLNGRQGRSLPSSGADLTQWFRTSFGLTDENVRNLFAIREDLDSVFADLLIHGEDSQISEQSVLRICENYIDRPVLSERVRDAVGNAKAGIAARTLEELADRLFLSTDVVQSMISILQRRRSLVLSGPPGVGKSFIARELANFLSDSEPSYVQFHPSYDYESFVSGFRPVMSDQGLTYEVRAGVILSAIANAEATSEQPPSSDHVLIVDEINRSNVSSVFGEVMTAMEYPGRLFPLQYGNPYREDGCILYPGNLLIIATMNAADRSTSNFDSALRRRFGFYDCSPMDGAFASVIDAYVRSRDDNADCLWLIDWLADLNAALPSADYALGISFFMGRDLSQFNDIRQIVEHDIRPYLLGAFGPTVMNSLEGHLDLGAIRLKMRDREDSPEVMAQEL